MAKRLKVELFEQIRRARRREPELSIRELARRFGTHRRTVREALEHRGAGTAQGGDAVVAGDGAVEGDH